MRAKLLFTLAGLALVSPALAQMRQQPTTYAPSAFQAHAARIEGDAVNDLKRTPQGFGWFVDLDMYISNDKAEYEALGKYTLLVFAAFSNDAAELPLAKVTVGGTELKCSSALQRDVPAGSATARAYGKFRQDTLCLLPLALERKSAALKVDFAKNRKNLDMSPLPYDEPGFVKADRNPVSPPQPDPLLLQKILAREYPGFGFGIPS